MTKLSGLISSHMRRESVLDFILSLFSPPHLQSPHRRLLDRMSQTKSFWRKQKRESMWDSRASSWMLKGKARRLGTWNIHQYEKSFFFRLIFCFTTAEKWPTRTAGVKQHAQHWVGRAGLDLGELPHVTLITSALEKKCLSSERQEVQEPEGRAQGEFESWQRHDEGSLTPKLPSSSSTKLQSLGFSPLPSSARLSPVISENIRATSPPLSYGASPSRVLASTVSDVARGLLPPRGQRCQTVPNKKKKKKESKKKNWGWLHNWCSPESSSAKETFEFILQDWHKVTQTHTPKNMFRLKAANQIVANLKSFLSVWTYGCVSKTPCRSSFDLMGFHMFQQK